MPKGKLVFALSISLGVFISHGFSIFAVAVCLYAAGTALIRNHRAVTIMAIISGGLSLLFVSGSGGPALLIIGAVLAVVFSNSTASRYLFSLSAAVILFSGAIEGIFPLTAAVLVASPVKRDKWRAVILAGGFSAVLIISGLPSSEDHHSLVLHESLYEGTVIWPSPAELNMGMPELILQAPAIDAVSMTLKMYAGGVRDSSPVGYVASAEREYPVYSGENTLIIDEPEFPVSIRISRSWRPFSHPVIHFYHAKALL